MKIILVRHGRSGHVHSGWIDGATFLRWREAYEAAGIDSEDVPPRELSAAALGSGVLAASVARRAIESAKALAPGREVLTSPPKVYPSPRSGGGSGAHEPLRGSG
jgi:broad specificity phosphatase PhoE